VKGIAWLRRRFERDTGGVAIFALVVLCLLYFFDEFDTAAFGVLAPDIERSFHLTDQKFVGLIVLNVGLLVLLAVPVGYLADRVRRTPLVVLSGILAGVFSFATGIVGTVGLLVVARFGNGLGLIANIPIHNSLLADYYPAQTRPSVYADHTNAMYLGAVIGPAAAGVVDPRLLGLAAQGSTEPTRVWVSFQDKGVSGAALQASYQVANEIKEGMIVTVFPDSGERYLGTQFWDEVLKYWEAHWKVSASLNALPSASELAHWFAELGPA